MPVNQMHELLIFYIEGSCPYSGNNVTRRQGISGQTENNTENIP